MRMKRYEIAVFNTEEMIGECTRSLNYVCKRIVQSGNTPTFYRGVDYYEQVVVGDGGHIAQYNMDTLIKAYGAAKAVIDSVGAYNTKRYHARGDGLAIQCQGIENVELLSEVDYDGDSHTIEFVVKDIPGILWEVLD